MGIIPIRMRKHCINTFVKHSINNFLLSNNKSLFILQFSEVVHPERSLNEETLPNDTTLRENTYKDFIKALQDDNRKNRADV